MILARLVCEVSSSQSPRAAKPRRLIRQMIPAGAFYFSLREIGSVGERRSIRVIVIM
jgi:hypothetical protein